MFSSNLQQRSSRRPLHSPMATVAVPLPLFRLLLHLLLFHVVVSSAGQEACPPFSCGQLQDVCYPFRRTGDPPHCGYRPYELSCQGNRSTISIGSAHYFVSGIWDKHISYPMFRVVDPNFFADGACGLPAQSVSSDYLRNAGFYHYGSTWASFMNCTEPIQNYEAVSAVYHLVSCLSNNSTFVYVSVAELGDTLRYLHPSCEFLSMIPVADNTYPSSEMDVFRLLQEGFDCFLPERKYSPIRICLEESRNLFLDLIKSRQILSVVSSLVKSEMYFAGCIDDGTSTFWITVVVVVLLQILQSVIVLLLLGRLVIAPLTIFVFFAHELWQRRASVDAVEKFLRRQQMLMPTRYAYTDIIAITRHFREKLGQGGFGSVFRGELAGGILVAVKMLGNPKCNGDEFISEVSTIGRIHHVNVVRLVGYCSEGSKRALVYEFMPNGSLDKYIFASDGASRSTFTSEKLVQIAIGVARGIDYLHRGCAMQILHFDIKPHNILLDRNFKPKISDFGLAKLFPKDNGLVSISAARGTVGYIAPEMISRSFGVVSYKSDVYSFGMLLMEMAGRRRNVDPLAGNSSQVYYPSWIYDKLTQQQQQQQQQQQEIGFNGDFEIEELEKKLSIVGLWCIQMKPSDRPTMTKVIEMLEADIDTLTIPPKPFFSSGGSISEAKTFLSSFSTGLSIVSE